MDADAQPRRGRPRDRGADARIERAAADLLADGGPDALTVDAVAAAAGVARTTVYRRYPSRAALLFAAVRHPPRAGPPPDTGSLEGDLTAIARQVVATFTAPGAAAVFGTIVAGTGADPAAREERARAIAAERVWVDEVVARHRDEIAPDVDADLVVDLLAGALAYRVLLRGDAVDDARTVALARRVAAAIRP